MFQFNCPHCSSVIRIDEKHRGKKGRCRNCGEELLVPAAEEEADEFLGACLSGSYNTEESIEARLDKAAINSRQLARNAPLRTIEEKKKADAGGWAGLIGLLIIAVTVVFYFGRGSGQQAQKELGQNEQHAQNWMGQIEQRVAEDAVKRYRIAKRSGNAIDAYVHAGFVCAAYLQAKDEPNYQKWKKIEAEEKRLAEMPEFKLFEPVR
ncbi:MAG: hypothetical protein ACKOEO_08065 [Planctomycetaceae bacterium]